MNQILSTKLPKKTYNSKQFKALFSISIIGIISLFMIVLSYKNQIQKEKILSNNLNKNYQIYKLYATSDNKKSIYKDSDIIGNISIPKLNLNYPIFYGINENLLKISPCRFYGNMPEEKSNLCIAGHNYDDNRFFSKIFSLELDDLILIENSLGNVFPYYVYDKYEINENEISSVINSNYDYELTLLTCNNKNNKRFVLKANQK